MNEEAEKSYSFNVVAKKVTPMGTESGVFQADGLNSAKLNLTALDEKSRKKLVC